MTDPQRYAQTCGSGICMDPADDGEWIRHYAYQTESDKWAIQHSTDSRELRRLCADRDEYKARAERLAEALCPLAELDLTADDFDQRPDSQPIYARNNTVITFGDVRKARAALHPTAAQERK